MAIVEQVLRIGVIDCLGDDVGTYDVGFAFRTGSFNKDLRITCWIVRINEVVGGIAVNILADADALRIVFVIGISIFRAVTSLGDR